MRKHKFNATNVIISIVVVLLIAGAVLYFLPIIEKIEKNKKGCCAGCTGCSKYTKHVENIMNKEGRSSEITVQGVIVDMRCYSQDIRNHTNTHFTPSNNKMEGCGTFCAKSGIPVGLLVGGKPGNKVYILLTQAPSLAKHMGKMAKVNGRLMKDSGGLFTISVSVLENSKYKPVEIRTPM